MKSVCSFALRALTALENPIPQHWTSRPHCHQESHGAATMAQAHDDQSMAECFNQLKTAPNHWKHGAGGTACASPQVQKTASNFASKFVP